MKRPDYRDHLTTGIVHFGPGAFHRAHQADYIGRLVEHDARWGIAAVSLRSAGTTDALRRQDGLYTLAIIDEQESFRTMGVHNAYFGPSHREALRRQLLDPAIRMITSTVSEKGYCLTRDGTLDFDHRDIRHDLANPDVPRSLIGWLAVALGSRRSGGLPAPAIVCCDNMASNGRKLGVAVAEFARRQNAELARWIEDEVRFPNTMVDSITPATDDALRQLVRERTGFDDEIPVRREAYAEWVIEDVLPAGMPDLASAGVTLTDDVAGWEKAKLRILNGSHSTLAYVGLLMGYGTVAEAMADEALRRFIERLIAEDIAPTLEPSPLDLRAYAAETLQRFRNPAIQHHLSQIAWDGSQKLPYRLLDSAMDALNAGRSIERFAVPVAAWILFLERQCRSGTPIVDPMADALCAEATSDDPVRRILGLKQIFPDVLGPNSPFGAAVAQARAEMAARGASAFLRAKT